MDRLGRLWPRTTHLDAKALELQVLGLSTDVGLEALRLLVVLVARLLGSDKGPNAIDQLLLERLDPLDPSLLLGGVHLLELGLLLGRHGRLLALAAVGLLGRCVRRRRCAARCGRHA